MLAIVQYDLLDPPGLAQTLQAEEEEEDISLMRVAELPQQDSHKAVRKKPGERKFLGLRSSCLQIFQAL